MSLISHMGAGQRLTATVYGPRTKDHGPSSREPPNMDPLDCRGTSGKLFSLNINCGEKIEQLRSKFECTKSIELQCCEVKSSCHLLKSDF